MQFFTKPTDELVNRALKYLGSPDQARGFFGQLNNPHWVVPLAERLIFDAPPEPEEVEGGVRCRVWAESRYLVRMANLAPKEVAAVMAKIETRNWIIVEDVIHAALAMPGPNAASLVPTICKLVSQLRLWHVFDEIGRLVSRLASADQIPAAIRLFEELFEIRHVKGPFGSRQGQDYAYLKGIGLAIEALLPKRANDVLNRVLDWQRQAMLSEEKHRSADDDYSYIWRPAIEDHEQNRDFELAAKMVSIVRDAIQTAVRDGRIAFHDALEMLVANESQLLARLRIHLIAECAEMDPSLAKRTMLDRELFSGYATKHEYSQLVAKRFDLLSADEKAVWFGWIDAGPEAIKPDVLDSAPDEQTRVRQREYWHFSHLHWIRNHLTGPRLEFYNRMHKEHGDPELSEFNVYFGEVKWEGEGALSIENLKSLPFDQALSTLATWTPDPKAPSTRFSHYDPDRAFRQYLELDVEGHSLSALALADQPLYLVRAFLDVMGSAAKDRKAIDVAAVLRLCRWVFDNQPVAQAKADSSTDDDHPEWSRDAAVRVIRSVCESRRDGKPTYESALRDTIKEMLPLVLDCPHTANVQLPNAGDDIRLVDWPMVVINSPLGSAMLTLYTYADWVIEHSGVDRKGASLPGGFELFSEVRLLLEAQLTSEPQSFVSRGPLGWRVGLLRWIDAEWLRERVDLIFNLREFEKEATKAYGWAAWNCFLLNAQPHVEFYRLLKDQFSYAVDQTADLQKAQDSRREPFARLAEHIILLFGRGNLGETLDEAWEADNGLLRRLITRSHPSVSAHALQFIGMSLREDSKDVPAAVIQRFRDLWEKYWDEVGVKQAKRNSTDYTFGYWFMSPAFDSKWLIEQLERVVQVAPKPDPDHIIMQRLARDCGVDPARCARIVRMMALGDDEGWRVSSWKDEARTVLEVAIAAGGVAQKEALQTRDALGRLGYLEFESLIDPKRQAPTKA